MRKSFIALLVISCGSSQTAHHCESLTATPTDGGFGGMLDSSIDAPNDVYSDAILDSHADMGAE